MPRTIRFHLDECCDNAVAHGLRRRGIDVTTTPEVGLKEANDQEQVAYVLAGSRVVVTHDAEFLRLQTVGTPHAGIVYRANDAIRIGELIREVYEPSERVNRVEFL